MASVLLGLTGLDALFTAAGMGSLSGGAAELSICSLLGVTHCILTSSHLLYLCGTLQIKQSQNANKNAITDTFDISGSLVSTAAYSGQEPPT